MRQFAISICLAGAFAPVAAHADVLEIGSTGAAWVAGGPATAAHPSTTLPEVGDMAIPEEAVASPAGTAPPCLQSLKPQFSSLPPVSTSARR